MFAAEWRWQGVWHSFSFLAWDLSMQQRTQIWIFNQFICIRACACSSNLNYAHKCIENSINALKCQNEPREVPKIDIKKFQLKSFHLQRWYVPYRNHEACCEKLWFVISLYPNLPQMEQINYHGMLMPLHDSMPSFMNFRRVLDLLEFKNQESGRVFDIHSHFLHGT